LVSITIEIEEETEGHLPACNRVALAVALLKKEQYPVPVKLA
jgi:hypothetical protein